MPDKILLNDLSRIHAPIRAELNHAMARVLDSNWFLRGREVEAFEEEWADFCRQKYWVACNSGTDALTLAALAMDISEASVQSNTLALTAIGLTVAALTSRSSTLMKTVELGLMQKMPFLYYSLAVLRPVKKRATAYSDAAHAHGWRPPSYATACWSFYPTKTLGALGDSGAVTTNDPVAARQMRELAGRDDQLRDRRQITSRMDEVQAAVLRVKLKYLPTWIEERREIAAQYCTLLPPSAQPVAGSNDLHHLFVVRVEQRNQLRTFLSETGVSRPQFISPASSSSAWALDQPISAVADSRAMVSIDPNLALFSWVKPSRNKIYYRPDRSFFRPLVR